MTLTPSNYFVLVEALQANLKKHRAVLRSTLECQFGLLDELDSRCILSTEQLHNIKAGGTMFEQNDKLLDAVAQQTDVEYFTEFL